MSKSLFASKTFWLAALQGTASFLLILTTSVPELQTVGGLGLIKTVLDIVLRFVTDKAVTL